MIKCSISVFLLVFFTFTGVIHGQSSTDRDNNGTLDKFKEIFGQICSGMKTAIEGIKTIISGGAGGAGAAAKLIFRTLLDIATTPIRIITTIAQTIMGALKGGGEGGSDSGDYGSTSNGKSSGHSASPIKQSQKL